MYDQKVMDLNTAFQNDDVDRLKSLLFGSFDTLDINGSTHLHNAAHFRADKCLDFLLSQIPHLINHKDNLGQTPLHRACYSGSNHCISSLLNSGADVSIKNYFGTGSLHYTAYSTNSSSSTENLTTLLDHGAVDKADKKGLLAKDVALDRNITWPSTV